MDDSEAYLTMKFMSDTRKVYKGNVVQKEDVGHPALDGTVA